MVQGSALSNSGPKIQRREWLMNILKFVARLMTAVILLAVSYCLIFQPSMAAASPLAVGGTLYPPPAEAGPSGGTILDIKTVSFAGSAFTGTLTTKVISGDANNTLGGLTFTYLISNDLSSTNNVERFSVPNFFTTSLDASYVSSTTGIAPFLIDHPSADVFGESFENILGKDTIRPGHVSELLVARTSSSQYSVVTANILDGSPAFASSFAPSTPVPEPSGVVLGLVALAGSACYLGIRNRKPLATVRPSV